MKNVAGVLLVVVGVGFLVASSRAGEGLARDAAVLTATPGKWQSEVVEIKSRDGTTHDEILEIEFGASASRGQSNAPDAQAKLNTSSLTKGIPGVATASVSFGDGSFRDVRLREKDGVRTMTITRAVEANDRDPAKTQRIHERFYSVSFPYELKDGVLTLKGFPTTNKVTWGVSEFIVPKEEIRFKVVP